MEPGTTGYLLERAIDATAQGITLHDARLPDSPAIEAHAGLEQWAGG